jgi:hypothetical protein
LAQTSGLAGEPGSRSAGSRTALGDQPQNLVRCHLLGVNDGLKTAVTFPTVPKMTNVPLIRMLGPFGGD